MKAKRNLNLKPALNRDQMEQIDVRAVEIHEEGGATTFRPHENDQSQRRREIALKGVLSERTSGDASELLVQEQQSSQYLDTLIRQALTSAQADDTLASKNLKIKKLRKPRIVSVKKYKQKRVLSPAVITPFQSSFLVPPNCADALDFGKAVQRLTKILK